MSERTEVTRIKLDSLSNTKVEITIERLQFYIPNDQPKASDLPEDVIKALWDWLKYDNGGMWSHVCASSFNAEPRYLPTSTNPCPLCGVGINKGE